MTSEALPSEGIKKCDAHTYISTSCDATCDFGIQLGACLQAGDVLVLTGDLGAGETQMTKGIAQGMGVHEEVTSPTFTIQMVYEGTTLPLYHFDLYRLNDAEQLGDTGLWDVLGADGPCVIEWGEQFLDELGDDGLDVYLTRLDSEVAAGIEPPRRISLHPRGARASQLVEQLAQRFDV